MLTLRRSPPDMPLVSVPPTTVFSTAFRPSSCITKLTWMKMIMKMVHRYITAQLYMTRRTCVTLQIYNTGIARYNFIIFTSKYFTKFDWHLGFPTRGYYQLTGEELQKWVKPMQYPNRHMPCKFKLEVLASSSPFCHVPFLNKPVSNAIRSWEIHGPSGTVIECHLA